MQFTEPNLTDVAGEAYKKLCTVVYSSNQATAIACTIVLGLSLVKAAQIIANR